MLFIRRVIYIPLQCPKCGGKMYATAYVAQLKILKERSWQVCKACDFEQQAEDFKRKLLTI